MSLFNLDNSSAYVVAAMRLLFKAYPDCRKDLVSEAHNIAEQAKTITQPQYDLAFGKALCDVMVAKGRVTKEQVTDEALIVLPEIVATDVAEAPKPVVTGKMLLDGEWKGPRFNPASTKLEQPKTAVLQAPEAFQKQNPHLLPTYATCEDGLPWGVPARTMAAWAWSKLGERKASNSKACELAKVLSVLYYAGLIKEGAMTPIGMVRRKQVRAQKLKGLTKRK